MPEAMTSTDGQSTQVDQQTNSQTEQTSSQVAEPKVLDLAEDALIRIKGSEKPVKFGDHVRGFQSQFTKASQKAAQLEKELQAERAQRQRYEQERQAAAQRSQGQPDVFEALRALPYLKGEDAVEIVQSIGEQIRQRDMVLLGALKQMQQLQKIVGGLHETSSGAAFEGKINRWLTDGGYPPEAAELAKEIYLAYEGDDLDEEFPQIFAERWGQLEKIMEARRLSKIREARPKPFIPGRGGDTKPSKPLEIDPRASAKEVAERLFPLFSGQDET